jgi:hypothetical protein
MLTLARLARLIIAAVVMAGMLPVGTAGTVMAAGMSCTATAPSVTGYPGAITEVDLSIVNTSSSVTNWIQIARPSGDYTIYSVSVDGWSGGSDVAAATFTDGGLAPGDSVDVRLWFQSTVWESAGQHWAVRTAAQNDGSGAVDCGGSRQTSVHIDLPSSGAGQGVSGVTVDPTQTSAIINWQTDQPTGSSVSYGTGVLYDQHSAYDLNPVTSHLVVVSGLHKDTVYHFRVEGMVDDTTALYSADGTFMTLAGGSAGGSVSPGGGTNNGGGAGGTNGTSGGAGKLPTPRGTIAIKANPTETVEPVVTLGTSVARPFTSLPVLSGTVTDNVAVARVDYSLDGGKTWVLVPNPPGLGTGTVRFTIAPSKLEDGDYALVIRGVDTSGNAGLVRPGTLVVDLEPPRIGSELVAYGSQAAVLDEAGRYEAAVGADQTVTMNAVGGPTSIVIQATREAGEGVEKGVQTFYLHQERASGLWRGALGFAKAGTYHLRAVARDGAGNQTVRDVQDVVVSAPARVTTTSGEAVAGAEVTVFQRDLDTGQWKEWDGEAYGQVNPAHTRADGVFGVLLPAGTYYMKVAAAGYQTVVTQVFELQRVTPLVPVVTLPAAMQIKVGKWSWTWPGLKLSRVAVHPVAGTKPEGTAMGPAALVGKQLPKFSLPTTDGRTVTSVGLQGHPTVLTVLSTWSPMTNGQLDALASVPDRAKAAVAMPVYVGEHAGRVTATLATSGHDLPALVDVLAVLGDRWGVPTVPTHIFVDQTGRVKAVYAGSLSTDELLERLATL